MRIFVVSLVFFAFLPLAVAGNRAPSLPDSDSNWLGGTAMKWKELEGRVVLLNVWTFACWNSYRSLPWIVSLEKKFPQLQIIGVHSPEFSYEKNRGEMRKVIEKYGVTYPQILDDHHAYWKRLNNRYWPSFYIVDKKGNLRGSFYGETHSGDQRAKEMEALIASLLKEAG